MQHLHLTTKVWISNLTCLHLNMPCYLCYPWKLKEHPTSSKYALFLALSMYDWESEYIWNPNNVLFPAIKWVSKARSKTSNPEPPEKILLRGLISSHLKTCSRPLSNSWIILNPLPFTASAKKVFLIPPGNTYPFSLNIEPWRTQMQNIHMHNQNDWKKDAPLSPSAPTDMTDAVFRDNGKIY